jgi:hypothetical protein
MCGCSEKNNVDLHDSKLDVDIKIYLVMAKYEVKEKWLGQGLTTNFIAPDRNNKIISWDNVSQEELALVYEGFNGGQSFINKIDKSSEKTSSKTKGKSKDKGKDEK